MKQYKPHGMSLHIFYKNKQEKRIENVSCFNLIDGDLFIWITYKSRPIIHKMKLVSSFFCSYSKY